MSAEEDGRQGVSEGKGVKQGMKGEVRSPL